MNAHLAERALARVEASRDEIVDFCAALVRIPTVNPPGENYRECAELLGQHLEHSGFEVRYHAAEGHAEHTRVHPRVNVVGHLAGAARRPLVHLNGHLDVVPPGNGWTLDPFAATVRDGRLYGRGSADMKAGLAAAVYAVEALRRAGAELAGSVELSGTVDEESGGQAGMGYLCERGLVDKSRTDYVIIPEPLNVDRVCVGHRGVYWFKVTAHGRIAHGSMPFLGSSAIDHMARFIDLCRTELAPRLAERVTAMPVVPPEARHATLNVNSILGGQAGREPQTPCVADRCEAVFDRRFLLEEGFEPTKKEITRLLERAGDGDPDRFELTDLLLFRPVQTPEESALVASLERAVQRVLGKAATRVASPGTYDHKHVSRIGGVEQCVAYGPGILELAHQTDEYVVIDDLIHATKVLALAVGDLACAH